MRKAVQFAAFIAAIGVLSACGGETASTNGPITPAAPIVSSIVVSGSVSTIEIGSSLQLSAQAKDAGGSVVGGKTFTWLSANDAVASVDANGQVSAKTAGSATITASTEGKTGSLLLTVIRASVASVSVSVDSPTLPVAGTRQATATAKDAAGNTLTDRTATWASSDMSKASISSTGLVTGIAAGSVTITATSEGKTGSVAVTVTTVPVSSVSITPQGPTLDIGGISQLNAAIKDANGVLLTDRALAWTSSNSAVATVDATGRIVAVSVGTATVSASSEGMVGTTVVTVAPKTGLDITITPTVPAAEFVIGVDGGSFGAVPQLVRVAAASSGNTRAILSVPAGGPYRVRVLEASADSRTPGPAFSTLLVVASGKAGAVMVTNGSRTTVAIAVAAPTVDISAPTQVQGGSPVSITWTWTDPGDALDTNAPLAPSGEVMYDRTAFTNDFALTSAFGNGTKVSANQYRYTATFTAPLTPGPIYFSVTGITFANVFNPTPSVGNFIAPSASRGEALRVIIVQ